jgi:hypothetical protein
MILLFAHVSHGLIHKSYNLKLSKIYQNSSSVSKLQKMVNTNQCILTPVGTEKTGYQLDFGNIVREK